jgi:hypothetical protein
MTDIFKLDKWQQRVMEAKGNITIRSGRQVGKSTVISIKAHEFATTHPGTTTLVIAASLKQAGFIFEKIKALFDVDDDKALAGKIKVSMSRDQVKIARDKHTIYSEMPTKTRIRLKNGSQIYSLPAGRTGAFIRGLTLDLLIADEAAYIPEMVWNSVLPMIAVSRKIRGLGRIILLSTPFGKGGYFYSSHFDKDFDAFHVSSEDCPRMDLAFLKKEKQRMTKAEYAQEYLGEFVDEWNQFFPTELIKKCMTFIDWNTKEEYDGRLNYYLGVDIARYGGDENAFVVAEMTRRGKVKIVKVLTTDRLSTMDTMGRIQKLDEVFNFRKIFIDDAGIGAGVTDYLLEVNSVKRKIVALNNARRSMDREDKKGRILKEDLYSNALVLMEAGSLEMISNLKLLKSLKSMIYEYTAEKNIKLYGDYSHISEAFVRACWCIKEKGHRLFLY